MASFKDKGAPATATRRTAEPSRRLDSRTSAGLKSDSWSLRGAKTWNWHPRVEVAKAGLLKRIAIGFMGVCVLGALGFLALAWRSSIAPIDPPASTNFPADLVAKGEVLAGAGHC